VSSRTPIRGRAATYVIRLRRTFRASPERVFRAVTNSAEIRRWCGQSGVVSRQLGGRFAMFDEWATGEVLVYDPPSRLVHTWRLEEWPADVPSSEVRWRFTPCASGTRVDLVHLRLPNAREQKSHGKGWLLHYFEPLERFFARR
jgi:uncharacterized protein YndB with AHSA1/START domain